MTQQTSYIPETLSHLAVPIETLHPYPGNARRGNVGKLAESIRAHGQYRPLVVNRRDNIILAGNHTYQAMRQLGATSIAVTFVDVDDAEAARINLVDNRLSDEADYDLSALLAQLNDLGDLGGTGYDAHDLDELASELADSISTPERGEAEKPRDLKKPGSVKVVVTPDDLAIVERALQRTGEPRRGEALCVLARAYLGEDANGPEG